MENHLPPHTKVLSMKLSCCDRCPERLKKKVMKMPGVESVGIDTEEDLVYVVGKIDGATLVKNVAKLGKAVKLLSSDNNVHKKEQQKHQHKRKQGKNGWFQKKVEEKDEDHVCEAYVPPEIDARVCRDFYCKVHPRGRIVEDKVPPESSSAFFRMGGLPFYGGSNQYPYRYPVRMGPSQSGYGYGYGYGYGRRAPQYPFGFQ